MSLQFTRRGLLLVISAPSGAGKTVVLRQVLASTSSLAYSVSVTSRRPRPAEENGRDYWFVSRPAFEELAAANAFYEWAEVHGNLYGTRASTVEDSLAAGNDLALDIDVQGGLNVKRRCPEAVLVFLLPPSLAVLEQRLRGRGTEAEEQIRVRLENARREMAAWREYDYAIVNEELPRTVAQVRSILEAERQRTARLAPVASPDWPAAAR